MIGFSAEERELLSRIAGVFDAVDPVPEAVRRAAEDAALVLRPTRTWRRLELVRDNMMGVRERRLGFGPGGLDVRVRRVGVGVVAVRGLVEQAATVWVRWPGGAGRSVVDAGGRFALAEVPAGPLCLAVTGLAATGKGVRMGLTPWFVC
ncbi:MAG TPA: hypothetical protein VGM75_31665 [Pseudonocardiaceae bacterium]|jgi:hypothetical protein